jgi:chromosome segregation protein
VRKAEATLYHLRWIAANTEITDAERAKDLSVRAVAAATLAQSEAGKGREAKAAALPPLRESEAKAAAALQRLVIARETLESEEARAKERVAELDRRLAQFEEDIARERTLAADAETAFGRLAAEEKLLTQEAEASAKRRKGVDARVTSADAAVAEAEKSFGELTSALADLAARRRELDGVVREQTERLGRLESELGNIAAGLAAADSGRPDIAALASSLESAQSAAAEAEKMALAAEAAHTAARDRYEAARGPLAEAEQNLHRLETETDTLRKLLAVDHKKSWVPVMDDVIVAKGFEAALGAALGDDLDAGTDPSAPMHWMGAETDPADPQLPASAEPLAKHVKGPRALARRLALIGVVAQADGPKLAGKLKSGQRLVSREGDLWRWDGYTATAHAPTGAAQRLAARSRLTDVERETAKARDQVEKLRQTMMAARGESVAAGAAEADARLRWRDRQRDADAARDLHAAAEREVGRHAARVSALTEAQTRIAHNRDEAASAKREAERALAALASPAKLEEQLGRVRSEIESKRTQLAEARAEAQALAREIELAERRKAAIGEEREAWAARHNGALAQITTIEARAREAKSERVGLADSPKVFAEKRSALIDQIEKVDAERRAAADRLAEAENVLGEADRAMRNALEALGTAREEAARAEEQVGSAKRRLTDIAHEIKDRLECEPDAVAALAGITERETLPDVVAIEAELEKLRRDRERLGAVNLRAEEELREIEEQHTKLTVERDDLVEAIKRLRLGIQNLNREARERLLASFAVVNGHFQRLFTQLFAGGSAELQLIEHDDPLEAGLEIMAKPPGKKPATLSLLSGGEQALTALALIFAVFLTNPAPICVLDEVDAPLDDHNVQRFCDLLDEMTRSTDTRFVIITHNPITMARMNRLFGVTMAERGVSQLVSVDLEGAVKMREAS